MRVLAITRLWPNRLEPQSAAYNRQQFAALARYCDLQVLAAHPYIVGAALTGLPRRHAALARMPRRDEVAGIPTNYMRQYYVPKVDSLGVPLFLLSLLPHRRLLRQHDRVLASWAYPDACAVLLACDALGIPCYVKVHGSDLNVEASATVPRAVMRRVFRKARAFFAVSSPLAGVLRNLGVPQCKIHLVPNGVDDDLFRPRDRRAARAALGVGDAEQSLLFVGNLKEAKGLPELMLAFDALAPARPRLTLTIVGDGPWKPRLLAWAASHGPRVRLLGQRAHEEVAEWLAASDLLVLPSWREGSPNAVLEAVASGRPVVATRVGGIPDVLRENAGILVPAQDAKALASGLTAALDREWRVEDIRRTTPPRWQHGARIMRDVLAGTHGQTSDSSPA
jgi:glycosyltransferase involved in cell wall biosynthesis